MAKKKIRQRDIETGEEIEVYDSITEAAYDNWLTFESLQKILRYQNGIMPKRGLRFEYA